MWVVLSGRGRHIDQLWVGVFVCIRRRWQKRCSMVPGDGRFGEEIGVEVKGWEKMRGIRG